MIGLAVGAMLLGAGLIYWIGRLLNWGRPEDFPDLDENGRASR